jgi:hypothetical protein
VNFWSSWWRWRLGRGDGQLVAFCPVGDFVFSWWVGDSVNSTRQVRHVATEIVLLGYRRLGLPHIRKAGVGSQRRGQLAGSRPVGGYLAAGGLGELPHRETGPEGNLQPVGGFSVSRWLWVGPESGITSRLAPSRAVGGFVGPAGKPSGRWAGSLASWWVRGDPGRADIYTGAVGLGVGRCCTGKW